MTGTAPGGDVRGFYLALGVELPGWAHTEAPVRCFADPDAHEHQDRNPSCSVNLYSGAFNCHGCGAHGGAYDAALATGFSPREAIDLMVAHGLTERRPRPDSARIASPVPAHDSRPGVTPTRVNARATGSRTPASDDQPSAPASLAVSSAHARAWAHALSETPELLGRLCRERGWQPGTLRALGVGFDGERITVPISDERGALQGLLRLRAERSQRPKVIAVAGTRLGLIPHPKLASGPVVLVEGPSDMLAARSVGLAAIAVPGTHAWRAEWAALFAGRQVAVVMDCDRPGRQAAERIAHDLERHGVCARIVELAPERDDGYDLSDWLHAGHTPGAGRDRFPLREASTRVAHAGGDVWTEQIGAAMPAAASAISPRGDVATGMTRPGNGARSLGCTAS